MVVLEGFHCMLHPMLCPFKYTCTPRHLPLCVLVKEWLGFLKTHYIQWNMHEYKIYTTDVPFSVEYKPLNIAVNIQWILTCNFQWILSWNYSYHTMPIQSFWCNLWYKNKTTWLMDRSRTFHVVDKASSYIMDTSTESYWCRQKYYALRSSIVCCPQY